ncbi:MAG: hypothetical protein ACFFAX_15750 [Promethearchaeota archaeon]
MLMTIALTLLGLLAVGISLMWWNRVGRMETLLSTFEERFDVNDVDISGNKKYTNCLSHHWVIRNVVRGDYLKSGESLSDFIGENTMVGTMLVGLGMGIGPVLLVLVMFESFFIAGAAMVTVLIAVFIIRPSGEVGVSYELLTYLVEQEPTEFKMGDWAYAMVSSNRIKRWAYTLILIAVFSFALAPIGDILPDAVGLAIATYFAVFMQQIYFPLAAISPPLALVSFIISVPLVPLLAYALFQVAQKHLGSQSDVDGI